MAWQALCSHEILNVTLTRARNYRAIAKNFRYDRQNYGSVFSRNCPSRFTGRMLCREQLQRSNERGLQLEINSSSLNRGQCQIFS